jgi:hypothetical protein
VPLPVRAGGVILFSDPPQWTSLTTITEAEIRRIIVKGIENSLQTAPLMILIDYQK